MENTKKHSFEDLNIPWWGYLLLFVGIYFGATIICIILELIAKYTLSEELLADKVYVENLVNLLQVLTYVILFVLFLVIFRKSLKDIFSRFKMKETWVWYGIGMAILYGGAIIYNQIIDKLDLVASSANQESVNTMIESTPLLGFLYVCVLAPIMEEFMFRLGLYRALCYKNKTLAFLVTMVIFASIHLIASISSGTLLEDLISLPTYLVGAFGLTLVYHKSQNIVSSIITHMTYNTIGFLGILMTSSQATSEVIRLVSSLFANIL